MEIAPPATEPAAPPAMEAMPVAVEPAAVAAPELTPPGMSHEATSGTKRIMYAPTSIPMAVHAVGADALQPQRAYLRP